MIGTKTMTTLATLAALLGLGGLAVSSPQDPAERQESLKQVGGRIIDDAKPTPDMQHTRGKMIRPMVPSGGSSGEAPEEGTFTLRPGDMLELEAAIGSDQTANLTFKVEDEAVVLLLPTGVRELVPVSMIAGEPKPITGLTRYAALFQAQKEGETVIRMTLGRKMYEYKVKVSPESAGTQGQGEGNESKSETSKN